MKGSETTKERAGQVLLQPADPGTALQRGVKYEVHTEKRAVNSVSVHIQLTVDHLVDKKAKEKGKGGV